METLADKIRSLQVRENETAIIFMGQAGFILKDSSGFLTAVDLYLSDCCEREFGFKRLIPKLLSPLDIVFNVIIATHGHYDHFDIDAIPCLMSNGKTQLYTTSGGIDECCKLGITQNVNLIEQGKSYTAGNIKFDAVFCDHGSLAPDAVGLIITCGNKKIYVVGDSCLRLDKAAEIQNEKIDVMFVPINGAYGNLNENDAVNLTQFLKPNLVVPCHYGNFNEHGGNVNKFIAILQKDIPAQKYIALDIGEYFMLN